MLMSNEWVVLFCQQIYGQVPKRIVRSKGFLIRDDVFNISSHDAKAREFSRDRVLKLHIIMIIFERKT